MDNQISSRIEYDIDGCGLNDESTWGQGYKVIAEMLVKWDEALDHTIVKYVIYRIFEVIQQQ